MTTNKFLIHITPSLPPGTSSRRPFFGLNTVVAAGLLVAISAGCDSFMQKPHCQALAACGGDPSGDWILARNNDGSNKGGSCSEDLYLAPTDTRLVKGDLPAARMPPPEPALFDWCLLLVTNGGKDIQITPPRFAGESPPVGAASVRIQVKSSMDKDAQGRPIYKGDYSVGTTRTGNYELHFPATCMRAFGAMDGRPADPTNNPDGPPVNICKQLEVPVNTSGVGEGAFRNIRCEPDGSGGCLCKYNVSAAGGGAGSFSTMDGDTILALPNTNFPQRVKYCAQGDRLQLTGADGEYLFDQFSLRTLDLYRAPPVMP